MKKRFFIDLVLALLSFLLSSCKKNYYKDNIITSGDFCYLKHINNNGDYEAFIMGLSEKGKQSDTVVFPNVIDGLRVERCGKYPNKYLNSTYCEVDSVKNVYLSNLNYDVYISLNNYSVDNRINIYVPVYNKIGFDIRNEEFANYFVPYDVYKQNQNIESKNLFYANLIYYIEENGSLCTYFVDYCNGTIANVIPPTPIKSGYVFKGWFLSINGDTEWDFANDVVPQITYDGDGTEIVTQIKLYAKFIKTENNI